MLCTYYSICAIPLCLIYSKRSLFESFCYLNYLIGRVFNTSIYFNENMRVEQSLILSNHQSMIDVFIGVVFQCYNKKIYEFCLRKFVGRIPGIGWWCRLMQFPHLDRTSTDLHTLSCHYTANSIIIYPEGTRFTKEKYKSSVNFAKMNACNISKHSLLPRTNGSYALFQHDTVKWLTFSFIVYFDQYNKRMTNVSNTQFPDKIFVYNKHYHASSVPTDYSAFKRFVQNEFLTLDTIEFNPNDATLLRIKPRIKTLFCILFTSIYPYFIIKYRATVYKFFNVIYGLFKLLICKVHA